MPDAPHLSRPARLGLIAGAVAFALTLLLPAPPGLPPEGWRTLGLALLMAIWWSTEPVPVAVTALLPLVVLPLATGSEAGAVASDYGNPLVFLFLGGFLLAEGVRRWDLHRRIAHAVVRTAGTEPRRLVLGFMAASALLSMWISNTATVVMLLPVALSVIAAAEAEAGPGEDARRFALALLLGLAYAASIGGAGTLIGTPPNALMAGYLLERRGLDLSFVAWSAAALPVVAVFLPLAWLLLTRLVFPTPPDFAARLGAGGLAAGLAPAGPMSMAERRVAAVFLAAALLWAARPLLNRLPGLSGLSDAGVALLCAGALFLIPAGTERRVLLRWEEARAIPWHVLILFGGGLALAGAMDRNGLAAWLGDGLASLGHWPDWAFLLVLTATVVLLTELASNTATAAAFLPVVGAAAEAAGLGPVAASAAVALSASCAFMLPVATPPNALVFASGHVRVADMVRAGVLMNLLSVTLVTLAALTLLPALLEP
ncbi:MAG: SLC13 family permease [Pseudomonadota bacterium]